MATSSTSHRTPIDVVIVGSGVIGLTIAAELIDKTKLKVAIVAKDLPEDVNSPGFASPWAGCNWCSFAGTGSDAASLQERSFDRATYLRLGALASKYPDLCEKITFYDVWSKGSGKGKEDTKPWFADGPVTDFAILPTQGHPTIPGNNDHGITYSSYIIDAPSYIQFLSASLKQRGVPIVRSRLLSIDQAYDLQFLGLGEGHAKLVINASGLGAKTLLGVEDPDMYPIRGQTILVKAPSVKTCYMQTPSKVSGSGNTPQPIYIIPRPGPEGHVILGGTFMPDDWNYLVDHKDNERILKGCYALCPELGKNESWRDIEIVNTQVGLRPARKGGARVESEVKTITVRGQDAKRPLVHCYGFGAAGYQNSFGAAEKTVRLVKEALPSAKL